MISFADKRAEIRFAIDYFTMRAEKYAVIGELAQSKRAFVLTGYILAKKADRLKNELEKRFDLAVEFTNCDPAVDPPIVLQNHPFSAPVEGVLESFGLPGRGEVDPCSVMSIFYYVLFGLMLSDAAYGLLVVIGCGVALLKFKNMESGHAKNAADVFLLRDFHYFLGIYVRQLFWRPGGRGSHHFFRTSGHRPGAHLV